MKRTELKRTSWDVSKNPRKPLPKVNVEATKKRQARRAKARRSPENKAVMADAVARANGVCECGCHRSFDTSDGPKGVGAPEFHHTSYDPPRGIMVRRECHHKIEMSQHPTRAARRKAVGA